MLQKLTLKLCCLVWLIAPITAFANLSNGDFSSYSCTGNTAFTSGCVTDWSASHGSPSLNAPGEAWMWSYSGRGEGIFAEYEFEEGKCYEISYRLRVFDRNVDQIGAASTFNVVATSSLTPNTSTAWANTPIPNPAIQENIHVSGFTNYPNGQWTSQTVTFTPSMNSSQVWIFPRYNGASINSGQAELSVDDVKIQEVSALINPAFTYTRYCAPDGTISVQVSAPSTAANHWYGLIETTTPGATTGGTLVSLFNAGPNVTSHTFTGLCKDKYYYIKHGMYGNCAPWQEQRQAIPTGNVSWNPMSANFNFDQIVANGMNVSVTVSAATNGVYINNWWGVFDAEPNCSVLGNNMIGSIQWGSSTTFNSNLQVNHCYYIKHGIWNCCSGWMEVRKYFKVIMQFRTSGSDDEAAEAYYEIEEGEIEYIRLEDEYLNEMEAAKQEFPFNPEFTVVEEELEEELSDLSTREGSTKLSSEELLSVYPNPVSQDQEIHVVSNGLDVLEAVLVDFYGESKRAELQRNGEGELSVKPNAQLQPGIYFLQMKMNDESTITKRVIIR